MKLPVEQTFTVSHCVNHYANLFSKYFSFILEASDRFCAHSAEGYDVACGDPVSGQQRDEHTEACDGEIDVE